ncbi:MAG: type II toxin-antitoxin system HigB family toxin [Isosphaeraceae bacterium]
MHIIPLKPLRDFSAQHPDAEKPLLAWHREAEHAHWETFADVREAYPHADKVGRFIVFNIGGNKYRIIAAIHFNRGKVYVRHVLTHREYDRGVWKEN